MSQYPTWASPNKSPRISYIALVGKEPQERAIGPYLSFRKAEGFAKAWGGCVLVLERESDFLKEEKKDG